MQYVIDHEFWYWYIIYRCKTRRTTIPFVCYQTVWDSCTLHYNDVIMGAMATQITSPTFVYTTVYSGADNKKHQSFASLAYLRGFQRWPVNSPHKGPVTRKMLPFDDVIMGFGADVTNIWLRGDRWTYISLAGRAATTRRLMGNGLCLLLTMTYRHSACLCARSYEWGLVSSDGGCYIYKSSGRFLQKRLE